MAEVIPIAVRVFLVWCCYREVTRWPRPAKWVALVLAGASVWATAPPPRDWQREGDDPLWCTVTCAGGRTLWGWPRRADDPRPQKRVRTMRAMVGSAPGRLSVSQPLGTPHAVGLGSSAVYPARPCDG